ncbi:hypothetical protein NC652_004920 [Populus alba x Populus x berolinensis]|nr:hypothetical protein NC652_004920 [Populus alba x Populus x berolinensis]
MEIAHFLFGISGNATALFLFLAPTITFRRIIRSKSTELFSGIPYVMTMLNCLLSAWCGLFSPLQLLVFSSNCAVLRFLQQYSGLALEGYGMPFVSKNNILVSTINGTGAAIEVIYVLTFIIYAPKKEKAKFIGLLTLVLTTFAGVALVSLVVLQGKSREILCGFAAAIFSIIMYGSPLSIMVPNGVGGGLGALQLILYFIYRNNKGEAKKPGAALPVHSMQMGIAKLHQQKELAANESHVDKPLRKSILDWYDQSRVLSPEKSEKKRKDDDEERGEMDVQ